MSRPTDQPMSMSAPPQVIGWREPASLPDWGIGLLKTKVDTGARTSAIHVDNIQKLPGNRVRFDVVVRVSRLKTVSVETDVVRLSRVRPSTGARQQRLVVRTKVRLGGHEREIELSLVSRHGMLCRLLLGRSALKELFLVDPATPYRLYRRNRTRMKRSRE